MSNPDPTIVLTQNIKGSILFFSGAKDPYTTPEQCTQIDTALTNANVNHEVIIYPEANHGFFCDDRHEWFHKASSEDPWKRVQKLFMDKLK